MVSLKVLFLEFVQMDFGNITETSVRISNVPIKILDQAYPWYKLEASAVESTCALTL